MSDSSNISASTSASPSVSPDYSQVLNPARIAVYDDALIAPRIITVEPTSTTEFIQNLAVAINDQVQRLGGKISYTVILEVTENFIHAQFKEIVVSIMDGGNTIRFTDQGPGIADIEKAVKPGFTSAIEPMKHYIRGVGSGLPIVHDWMELKSGYVNIESNIGSGAAVTISMVDKPVDSAVSVSLAKELGEKEIQVLRCFRGTDEMGVTEISKLTGLGSSSVYYQLKKLEDHGLLEQSMHNKKRKITSLGIDVLARL